jgi:hypothetical protein
MARRIATVGLLRVIVRSHIAYILAIKMLGGGGGTFMNQANVEAAQTKLGASATSK